MGGPPDMAHTHVPYTTLQLTDGLDIDTAPVLADLDLVVCSHPEGSASLIAQDGRLSRSDRPAAVADLFPPLLPQDHFHGVVPVIGDLNIPTIPSATLLGQNHKRGRPRGQRPGFPRLLSTSQAYPLLLSTLKEKAEADAKWQAMQKASGT